MTKEEFTISHVFESYGDYISFANDLDRVRKVLKGRKRDVLVIQHLHGFTLEGHRVRYGSSIRIDPNQPEKLLEVFNSEMRSLLEKYGIRETPNGP